jgi:type I restriction enzyme S subunit
MLNLSAGILKKLPVVLPDLISQKKIAAILSAYDDLIENNLQRIKLLEEMAQITYEEWFVRMKFPGHETAQWDKETGLPEGWERLTFFDVMDVLSGGTPKTDNPEYWNGTINFYTPKDAASGIYTQPTEKKITADGLKTCNSKLYPKDTLFITARGTVGKLNLAHEPMAMNQSCYALRAKDGLSQYFLYCSVYKAIDAFKGAANGGVFDAIVVDTFKFLFFVKPNVDVVNDFTVNVAPVFDAVFSLLKQNELLREAREILLPRLMTGVIDVDQVEVPEALLARVA